MHIQKKNQFKLLAIKIVGFICLSSLISTQAQQVVEGSKSSIDTSYLESKDELEDYILDTGDTLFIEFINVPDLSRKITINEQGEIFLERLKYTYVRGLTIKDLTKLLEQRYKEFLIDPNIYIRISTFKPIRVTVRGEVRSPSVIKLPSFTPTYAQKALNPVIGRETLTFISKDNQTSSSNINSGTNSNSISNSSSNSNSNSNSNYNSGSNYNNSSSLPLSNNININRNAQIDSQRNSPNSNKRNNDYITTLSNAIQATGGLTSYSDVSKIELVREIPIAKGGGKKRALIDFTSYTNNADPTNDIRLFDGDTIFIPALQEKDPRIIPNSVLSGLSPKYIIVSISGQIENPGEVKIPLQGTLSDVMNLTGPRKPLSGKVYLIRYNKDGTLLRKNIRYSSTSSPGSEKNPYLLSGDLITVRNSILGRTSGTLQAITQPIVGIMATKVLYDDLQEEFSE